MGPKFDSPLKIVDDGRKVEVVGPIDRWEGHVSVTFWAAIAQVQDDKFVVATGRSEEYKRKNDGGDDDDWDAVAEVNGHGGSRLKAGKAYAWGVASFKTTDGTYWPYQWEVDVDLV